MIRVSELTYSYTDQKRLVFPTFSAAQGAHWLLLGESGCGKTTLLHVMGGLLRSQQGVVEVLGEDITKLSESALDHFRGKHMGFIFQRNHLVQSLNVEDNLLMAPYLANLRQDKGRVKAVLERLGLSEKRQARVQDLSHGQAQRVAIARALMNKPTILLADEPTSALDDSHCEKVIDLLLEVARENQCTVVVATHDQRLKTRIPNQIKL